MTLPSVMGQPAFHLNLMIFLSMSTPPSSGINPVFAQAGYVLSFVEPTITVPRRVKLMLAGAGIAVNDSVRPEILLDHQETHSIVLLECKTSSWSYDSSTSRQARALLALNGTEVATWLGKPRDEKWGSIVAYFSLAGSARRILETLTALTQDLITHNVEAAACRSFDLCLETDGLYIAGVIGSLDLPGIDLADPLRVWALKAGEDPRPLYLIPHVHGTNLIHDDVADQALKERIRSAAVGLFRDLGTREQKYALDTVLSRIFPLWGRWGNHDDKKNIRKYVRKVFRDIFGEVYRETGVKCELLPQDIIVLPQTTVGDANKVRLYLSRAEFRRRSLDSPWQGLLDIPDE